MITMLTELGMRDGPSLYLSLALVDRPYDFYPRRVVCGYFARGVACCGVLDCPMICPMWCVVGARFLLRVCFRLGGAWWLLFWFIWVACARDVGFCSIGLSF